MFIFPRMFPRDMGMPFNVYYRCYSVSMMPNAEEKMRRGDDIDNGGKIFLPPAALQRLTDLNVEYPMLFKLTNPKSGKITHCGVLEFVADDQKCYIPYWMMKNLELDQGQMVQIESATLPVATFALFQPQTSEFQEITDQKAILEQALRNFACLTVGDMIGISYNNKLYELLVMETKPANAVSVIECDLPTDFAPAADYVPSNHKLPVESEMEESQADFEGIENEFTPFVGGGNRLDGKSTGEASNSVGVGVRRGQPDLDYIPGRINFVRNFRPLFRENVEKTEAEPFGGRGNKLKDQIPKDEAKP